jgi:Ca2+:H+ antiporter
MATPRLSSWTVAVPLLALALVGAAWLLPVGTLFIAVAAPVLFAAVLAAVHHAEVVAHRVGEPFGTLILAVAVTVIEVALIVSMMLAGGPDKSALPRDTIFSAIMIICNGVVGLCLLAGGLKHHEQTFRLEGATSALATLIALATLSLVLPTFTTSAAGPRYTDLQVAFAATASLVLWGVFVFVQTVRHRDYFLPPAGAADESAHAPPPSDAAAWASFGLMAVALVAVIGLAKVLSPAIERGIEAAGAPQTVIGIVIALLVLLPETWAALRAARADRLQTSLNLALGSALASIGLTIPAVALVAVLLGLPLQLGLAAKDLVLLALTFAVAAITLGTGRTNVLQGAVHLVIFAAFLVLALVP